MTEQTLDAEHRLPTAYSQGFAYVRVVAVADPDDPGPLALSPSPKRAQEIALAHVVGAANDVEPEKLAG